MNHGKGKKLYQGAADIHKVDASELPAVTAVSREVIGDLQKLEAERRAFLDNGNSKNAPDPKTLRDFQFRRNAIILSGALKLKANPNAWELGRVGRLHQRPPQDEDPPDLAANAIDQLAAPVISNSLTFTIGDAPSSDDPSYGHGSAADFEVQTVAGYAQTSIIPFIPTRIFLAISTTSPSRPHPQNPPPPQYSHRCTTPGQANRLSGDPRSWNPLRR